MTLKANDNLIMEGGGDWNGSESVGLILFFPQQENTMGSLHNIDFGVFWASWGGSGRNRVPGTGSGFTKPYIHSEIHVNPYKPHGSLWIHMTPTFDLQGSRSRGERAV